MKNWVKEEYYEGTKNIVRWKEITWNHEYLDVLIEVIPAVRGGKWKVKSYGKARGKGVAKFESKKKAKEEMKKRMKELNKTYNLGDGEK